MNTINQKDAWRCAPKEKIMQFADGYIDFLNNCKTERLCTSYFEEIIKKQGYKNIDEIPENEKLNPGDKVYKVNRGKNLTFAVVGREDILNGVLLSAAHIDSPRLDLKPNPIYEDSNTVLFKTHYYGGIKKYQWTAIPLSLIGVVALKDGTVKNINIGECDDDPVFTVTDLLPHLAAEQMDKKLGKAFTGEDLNVIIGSIPSDSEKDKYKSAICDLIKEKYGINESDFVSAELEIVPSFKAKSVGLDKSLVGAYGQDDRVCAYTSAIAAAECENPQKTCICFLADKEEIGSMGNTGMQSRFFENFVAELIFKTKGNYNDLYIRKCLSNSMCLSSDVTNAVDPTYKSVNEEKNAAFLGRGVALCKYTGARGKSSTSDANAEYVAKIRAIFDNSNVAWQICELGKADVGGGGTVAQFIANLNVDTIDCGVPLLSMHAPFEISSKADVYSAYMAYKAFYAYK